MIVVIIIIIGNDNEKQIHNICNHFTLALDHHPSSHHSRTNRKKSVDVLYIDAFWNPKKKKNLKKLTKFINRLSAHPPLFFLVLPLPFDCLVIDNNGGEEEDDRGGSIRKRI